MRAFGGCIRGWQIKNMERYFCRLLGARLSMGSNKQVLQYAAMYDARCLKSALYAALFGFNKKFLWQQILSIISRRNYGDKDDRNEKGNEKMKCFQRLLLFTILLPFPSWHATAAAASLLSIIFVDRMKQDPKL